MKSFQTIIGIDIAQDSMVICNFDGTRHQVKELDYSKRVVRKELKYASDELKNSEEFGKYEVDSITSSTAVDNLQTTFDKYANELMKM